jgi:hypothetical protein
MRILGNWSIAEWLSYRREVAEASRMLAKILGLAGRRRLLFLPTALTRRRSRKLVTSGLQKSKNFVKSFYPHKINELLLA